jgi:hypothetical protein
MLAPFVKVLVAGGIATLAFATTAITTSIPAAAQFGKGYALDDDDAFEYRPARRGIHIEDDYDEPSFERRIVKRHIHHPVIERRVVEREVIQPVVKKTVVHRVVQPVIERRIVYRPPIVRKVIVVHKPIVKRAHFVHRPWHERRRCFLPERYLCG